MSVHIWTVLSGTSQEPHLCLRVLPQEGRESRLKMLAFLVHSTAHAFDAVCLLAVLMAVAHPDQDALSNEATLAEVYCDVGRDSIN